MIPLLFVIFITVATIGLGFLASGKAKTASELFVAGRSVSAWMNASAISGEYLSAASFMGIAGLVMKNGYDALWYPVGYAAGYLFLLLFIAGPLRRFGAYTIPDFAEGRFDSPQFRKVAVTFVLFIGFFYTMPQMKGAGVTMAAILNWPYWVGIAVVGSVITFNVATGGMKGITLVQAFQYWAKLFAISVPLFVAAAILGPSGIQPQNAQLQDLKPGTPVKVKSAPNNVLTSPADRTLVVAFPKGAKVTFSLARKPLPSEAPFEMRGRGGSIGMERGAPMSFPSDPSTPEGGSYPLWSGSAKDGEAVKIPAGESVTLWPHSVTNLDGTPVVKDGSPVRSGIKVSVSEPTEVVLLASADSTTVPVPNAPPDSKWSQPFGPLANKHGYPLLWTYSLIIALVCGTAGLPHILVRFYTNPDGKSAKRTALIVMALLGAFYIFTPLWGTLGRAMMPILYASNSTDAVVIQLPTVLQSKLLGDILSGVTSAGAFAAFMSTFSGLLVSMSGAFAHDIYGKILRPQASPDQRLKAFRLATIGVGLASMGLGLLVESFDIATMVGWAFAIGAASYFPLLLLGAWWRGLTWVGAASGMLLGGLLSLSAIVTSMLLEKKVLTWNLPPLVRALMEQPAIWGVPLAIAIMVGVSRATSQKVPKDVDLKMLRLHAPEELGFARNYVDG